MQSFKCIYSKDGDINYKYFQFNDNSDVEDIAWTIKRWTDKNQLTLIDIDNGKTKVLSQQLASLQGHAGQFLPVSDI
jgi:hypothetical protein